MQVTSRIPYLDLKTFRSDGEYPRLKAKGNVSRHLLPVLAKLLDLDGNDDLYKQVRKSMVQALLEFYSVVDTVDMFLEPDNVRKGQMAINNFLKCYAWLCQYSLNKGVKQWQMTVKFHYLAHAADFLAFINLKHSSTYVAEGFVGKVAKIGGSCLMGRSPWEVGGLLMQKMLTARAVHMRRELQ